MERFSSAVIDKLGCYVYRLIDPRSGTTFYVGRGKGNRVFSHAAGNGHLSEDEDEDEEDLKLQTIREIKGANLPVVHLIHRHGLDEQTSREVEAALIDAYPGLTNKQPGADSSRGVMHVEQIQRLYTAEEAQFGGDNVMLVDIDKYAEERNLILDAARFAWKADRKQAEKADYILAVQKGIIVGVFVAEAWLEATPANFPGFPEPKGKRIGFRGHEAETEVQGRYLNKRAPVRKRGEANPVRYVGPKYSS